MLDLKNHLNHELMIAGGKGTFFRIFNTFYYITVFIRVENHIIVTTHNVVFPFKKTPPITYPFNLPLHSVLQHPNHNHSLWINIQFL